MKNFNHKIVWITGASSGIGEALTLAFAQEGAKLVISARRIEELERVKNKSKLPDDRILVLPLDVTDFEQAQPAVDKIIQKFGRIDLMVHNAGVSQRSYINETDFTVYKRLMDVNFFSTVALTKAVLPHMMAQKEGHFIVMSSVAGKIGTIMRSGYNASKHALHGFYDSLRAEGYQYGIGVTTVCPGYIRTNISLNALNEGGGKFGKMDQNQANGIPPETCAQTILKAVKKDKKEIYIGGLKEVAAIYLKRFLPNVLFDQVRKNIPE
ncbi:NADP-dependent 3-hydroxy acid dehydrogenase YdfG [Dyadobacter jejuensis]|uniref:NADP-dependent 3-hydroxy acid dehydrogenase YdfG n=1 Tax=Dyadobacter jejuensis TaxID=1082580 RepID=A0A316AMJ4_9BACT|nr:SDR family oxidoreductase [Dyadobacter jejuensis]PWJ58294.1 NADP-dependent 3-hydroxy acid dehydrogenase YdfG [Dyadobacter jejuensis]